MVRSSVPVLLLAASVIAAPVPKVARTPISPANVGKLRPTHEVKKDVSRITTGPAAGELTLVRWRQPVEVVDEATLRPLRNPVKGEVIHFAAHGDRIAWTEIDSTKVRVKAGERAFDLETGNQQPKAAFSPDGKQIVTGGYGTEAKVGTAEGKLVRTLNGGGEGALWPVFTPDGRVLALGNRNDATRLFDAASGELRHTLPRRMTQEIAFSPDGRTLAAGYVDGTVGLWDVKTGKSVHTAKSGGEEVYTVAWNPKGDLLATAGLKGKIVVWDPKTLQPLKELDGPDWVISVRFSSDGSRLYSAGGSIGPGVKDRKVIVWEVGGK